MENQFIALVDISALSATPRDLSLVYVGMSRARTGLWVAMDASLEARTARAVGTTPPAPPRR